MSTQRQIDRLISQRASEWIETLKTAGPGEHEAFVDWLRESRRHVAEFLTLVALERELEGIDLRADLDRDALLKRISPRIARLSAAEDRPPDATPARQKMRPRRRWHLAAAASILVASTFAVPFLAKHPHSRQELVAMAGEQRAIELPDGSVVQLNSGAHVKADLNTASRDLELVRGEALFKVARDTQRPFRVRTGNAVVEALGTQFNINPQPEGTTVSVVEGRVQIFAADRGPDSDAAVVDAGGQAVIAGSGIVLSPAAVDVAKAIAWRQKRLVFQKTPLEEVVRQFNRHNAAPKLRLEGIPAGSRHYSATFDVDDPQSFGDYLARESDLLIDRRGDEIVIRPRKDN